MKTHKFRPKTVSKIGIVVKDIDKVIESWSRLFGIGPWTIVDVDHTAEQGRLYKVKLALTNMGPLRIELIQPIAGKVFHSEFLDKVGEGLHDIAFSVDDVDGEASNLVAQGAKVQYAIPGRLAFIKTGGPGDVIFELYKKG